MKTQVTHSPTPWQTEIVDKTTIAITRRNPLNPHNNGKSGLAIVVGTNREANAAFIVKACNHFQKMLDALKQVQIIVDSQGGMDRIGIALAKMIQEAEK
jgi:hypothetical protein